MILTQSDLDGAGKLYSPLGVICNLDAYRSAIMTRRILDFLIETFPAAIRVQCAGVSFYTAAKHQEGQVV
jgi:hypothetical protein